MFISKKNFLYFVIVILSGYYCNASDLMCAFPDQENAGRGLSRTEWEFVESPGGKTEISNTAVDKAKPSPEPEKPSGEEAVVQNPHYRKRIIVDFISSLS